MRIISKHDLVDGFNAVMIGGKKCSITQAYNYCTGKADKDAPNKQMSAEQNLIVKASRYSADANAIVVTLTKDNGAEITGRPVYIPALDQCDSAVA